MARWTTVLLCASAPVILSLAPVGAAGIAQQSILVAAPVEGHSGDPIYLSGAGFPPNYSPFITMVCPNWQTAAQYGNIEVTYHGPHTDAHGSFSGFKFSALHLHYFKSLGCVIYAQIGANPFGVQFPATYNILPPDAPLPYCWRHICIRVTATPRRVRSGQVETVDIRPLSVTYPWPGARAAIRVSYPGATGHNKTLTLSIHGNGHVSFPAPAAPRDLLRATIKVSAHLGAWTGVGSGQFTVVR